MFVSEPAFLFYLIPSPSTFFTLRNNAFDVSSFWCKYLLCDNSDQVSRKVIYKELDFIFYFKICNKIPIFKLFLYIFLPLKIMFLKSSPWRKYLLYFYPYRILSFIRTAHIFSVIPFDVNVLIISFQEQFSILRKIFLGLAFERYPNCNLHLFVVTKIMSSKVHFQISRQVIVTGEHIWTIRRVMNLCKTAVKNCGLPTIF